MKKVRIGTRGSPLALWQAAFIEGELERHYPKIDMERVIIKTEGDRDQKSSLTQIGGLGVFTKAIEDALLEDRIDIAVHSLKDLPSQMTNGLILGAVPERGPVEDVLVSEKGHSLQELAPGSIVATGSIRRRSQLLNKRNDLEMKDLRGNIDTRLRKLREDNIDAIVMAKAAILRLGLQDISYSTFETAEMIPAVGQGAIGVQIRGDDERMVKIVKALNHEHTNLAICAERAFLNRLDSGCQFPVGAHATVKNDYIELSGFVGNEDGKTVFYEKHRGEKDSAADIGKILAEEFIALGALDILKRFQQWKDH